MGALRLLEATGGLIGARSGRDSVWSCSTVGNGAAGVSGALGEGDVAHRGAFVPIHSVYLKNSVNISARVPAYHWERTESVRDRF